MKRYVGMRRKGRIQDSGFRFQDFRISGFRISGFQDFRIQDSGFRIQDSGFLCSKIFEIYRTLC